MEITGEVKISFSRFAKIQKEIQNIPQLREKIKKSLSKKVTDLLEIVLVGTINLKASDLHIEPGEEKAGLRVRIDGVLQDVVFIERKVYESLLSRLKLLAGIKLNITNRPQGGRFSVLLSPDKKSELSIEVRVSTLPAEEGEAIVLRILDPKSLIGLKALGLKKHLLEIFEQEIKKPNGMIVVTGPTGSGKTTTLYAFLKKIKKPEIKIITIEDPIEYHLEGISQTQVQPKRGYDFATGLKSILRQDPDVILVGEIRDLETSQNAIQAALTGHLVFTTLHTNDAAGTIPRLVSLGAKPANIGPAINLVIAQRLVRKICRKCGTLRKPTLQELKKIKKALKGTSKKVKVPKVGENIKIPQAKGCKDCNFTGYRDRIGIFEAFLVDAEIEKFILTSPPVAALRNKAMKKGMILMKQDGMLKVLEGITTIEEVERVTGV